ncbi:MAG: hypothetical protein Alpg2KO_14600 [Alphaproteobacteria bacterium]
MFGKAVNKKGASLTGYGLVVGLISIVALTAVTSSGSQVTALFETTATTLDINGTTAVSGQNDQTPPEEFAFTSHTFTTCGASGRFGPSLSSCQSAYSTDWDEAHLAMSVTGIQEFTVPATGTYRITATGGGGGDGTDSTETSAGRGVSISGEFALTQGQVLKILVGHRGGDAQPTSPTCSGSNNRGAGGGGGSFVTLSDDTPLIIAAGGNGDSWGSWATNGVDGRFDETHSEPGCSDVCSSAYGRAGGGGGLLADGTDFGDAGEASQGLSFVNGGTGGEKHFCTMGEGGFGGGGGSLHEGGGAGGYLGGSVVDTNQYSSTFPSYGAASYNDGLNPQDISVTNTGDGSVLIEKL